MLQVTQKGRPIDLKTVNRFGIGRTLRNHFAVEDTSDLQEILAGGRVGTPDLSHIKKILDMNPNLSLFAEVDNTFTWVKVQLEEE
jgi:hypothetical protein